MHDVSRHDLIIAGGGLAGSLLAWRLAHAHPTMDVLLIDAGARLGGNHTWSFFENDLTPDQNAWITPLICHSWAGYEVRFPKRKRHLSSGYRSITSDRLHDVISAQLGGRLQLNATVADVTTQSVCLADGRTLAAGCIIDARGAHTSPHLLLGYQKFLGLEVQLTQPHGQTLPIIMDATVAQDDGYRFVYTLPLAADRLLIEDTYYSDDSQLTPDALRAQILSYARAQGWHIQRVLREETGILPIILAGDIEAFLTQHAVGAPRIGLGAALFHPTTGYSLPDAVRLADKLSIVRPTTTAAARALAQDLIQTTWHQRSYFRLLNRMLFKAGKPSQRYTLLERFYGLDTELIQNFYAARLTAGDKARILIGKPPISIREALRCVSEQGMLERSKG